MFPDSGLILGQLHPAAFSATAGMDLRFHDGRFGTGLFAQLMIGGYRLFHRRRYDPFLNGYAVTLEQFFSLKFVQIHASVV